MPRLKFYDGEDRDTGKTFDITHYGPCLTALGGSRKNHLDAITLHAHQPILGPTGLWGCSQI